MSVKQISIKSLILLVSLMGLAGLARAAEISNLYDYEVPVASQSPDDRNAAIGQAMRQVLIKVTGNSSVVGQPALKSLLRNASQYVLKFTYRLQEAGSDAEEKRFIRVYFDAASINQKLRSSGLPVWGKSRPQLIAWVGIQDRSGRQLYIPDADPGLSNMLFSLADSYGIPFLLPLMDLQDQSSISSSDLWGNFIGPLQQASSRYLSDMIVVIRLQKNADGYVKSSWSLLDDNESLDWQVNSPSQDDALAQGMQKLAGLVAGAYAPAGGSSLEQVVIQVNGVTGFDAMVKLQNYLAQLESVETLLVRSIQENKVVFSLNLRGGMQSFKQAVALSNFIQPAPEAMDPVMMQDVYTPPEMPEPEPTISGDGEISAQMPMPEQPAPVRLDRIDLYYELK